MATAFLVLSITGALLVAIALRPPRATPLGLGSFLAGWMVSELAPHLAVAHIVIGVLFIRAGVLDEPQGRVAAAIAVASLAGLVALVRQGMATGGAVEGALRDGLGEHYREGIPTDVTDRYDLRVPWRSVVLPFVRRHPSVTRHRNIQYAGYGRRGRLDVYHHRDRPTGRPALVQIHGGAWVTGSKDYQGIPLMLHLAASGWVCVSPNYRLSPRAVFPDHLVDVKRAIAWVREHGPEYGADPGFIVITGGSAGGHLAALAALTANEPAYQPGFESADTSVAAAVPYYGVYDVANDAGTKAGRERARFMARVVFRRRFSPEASVFREASPAARVGPDAPPFFVIHGRHDTLVPVAEARYFVERLRAVSGAPVVYAELPGTQHAFDVFPSIRTAHVIRAVERFLDYAYAQYIRPREEHR